MKMSKIETAIRLVIEFNQAFNRHDVAGMMRLLTDDCVFEDARPAPDGAVHTGKEALAQFWQDFFRESPQVHIEIEEVFGLGFRCVTRWKYKWDNEEGLNGRLRGVDIFQIKGGLICEQLSYVKA